MGLFSIRFSACPPILSIAYRNNGRPFYVLLTGLTTIKDGGSLVRASVNPFSQQGVVG